MDGPSLGGVARLSCAAELKGAVNVKKKYSWKDKFLHWFDEQMSRGSLGLLKLLTIVTLITALTVAVIILADGAELTARMVSR